MVPRNIRSNSNQLEFSSAEKRGNTAPQTFFSDINSDIQSLRQWNLLAENVISAIEKTDGIIEKDVIRRVASEILNNKPLRKDVVKKLIRNGIKVDSERNPRGIYLLVVDTHHSEITGLALPVIVKNYDLSHSAIMEQSLEFRNQLLFAKDAVSALFNVGHSNIRGLPLLDISLPSHIGLRGDSAGLTFVLAFLYHYCSGLRERPLYATGTVELGGEIRPVGYIEEKLKAVMREAAVPSYIFIPKRNNCLRYIRLLEENGHKVFRVDNVRDLIKLFPADTLPKKSSMDIVGSFKIAESLFRSDRFDEAIALFLDIDRYVGTLEERRECYRDIQVLSKHRLAEHFSHLNKYDAVQRKYAEIEALSQQDDIPDYILLEMYSARMIHYMDAFDYDRASELIDKGLQTIKKRSKFEKAAIARFYGSAGQVETSKKNFNRAMQYLKKALATIDETDRVRDINYMANCYLHRYSNFGKRSDLRRAIEWLTRAERENLELRAEISLEKNAINSKFIRYFELKAQRYLAEDEQSIERLLREVIELAPNTYPHLHGLAYLQAGIFYAERGEKRKALAHLKEAVKQFFVRYSVMESLVRLYKIRFGFAVEKGIERIIRRLSKIIPSARCDLSQYAGNINKLILFLENANV